MPLGILYVSAALKASGVANVFTVNLNHQEDSDEEVLGRIIKENDIQIVGSGGISGQFIEVSPLMKLLKKIAPQLTTIVGGGMITADAIPAMEAFEGCADYGVIGEGEKTVVELVQAIYHNKAKNEIKGIIYKDGKEWVVTKRREDEMDLDSLPLPDYAGFDYDKYLATNGEVEDGVKYSPVAIIGGRSCKYNCTFCFHPSGSKYRQRSLDSIFSEIDYLVNHYEVNYIALREELFASDEQRVLDFCKRIKDYPLVWSIQLRVDSVSELMVEALKNSNCRYVFLGIESADNRILKSMRKNITIEQVEYALDLTIKAGLDTRSTIILGDEVETMESAYRTINWWLEHKKYSSIVIDMIIAFPGSTLYKNARKNGRIPDPIRFLLEGCPIINLSTEMSDAEYDKLVQDISRYNCMQYSVRNYKE
ncbi:MAG: radical SAM protein [Bacteroidales bacterium]|nr:radical SAM protein [Bacteroidales bacterium]